MVVPQVPAICRRNFHLARMDEFASQASQGWDTGSFAWLERGEMIKLSRNWQKQAAVDSASLEDIIDELTGIRANIDQAR